MPLQSSQPTDAQTSMVERLPPVSEEGLLTQALTELRSPTWLVELNLPNARENICCLRPRTRFVKRVLDIAVASFLLVVMMPVFVLAVIAIKLTSPGPVIFSQIRVGLNKRKRRPDLTSESTENCRRSEPNFGCPFRIYKLRTMNANVGREPSQAQSGDRRVTRVGRLLRKMRIDELPQLVNVLRGEMSMVGPRPECIEYMEELSAKVPNYLQRLGLKPGLTGIAQIEAGYANDLESYRRKVAYDLLYLQNGCVGNDLRIMARTVKVVMTGFGAL